MISCRDAKHLFDRYLDGELQPSLQTELHAHRLHCTDCQNELALLEACGDVIALDRREPVASASFTDRVLTARRAAMQPIRQRRRLSHVLLYIGSPMAAAACLAMMFSLFRVSANLPTAVRGAKEAMPLPLRELVSVHRPTAQEQKELEATPVAGFLEGPLALIAEKSKNTAEGARNTIDEILERVRQGLSTKSQQLAVEYRLAHPEGTGDQMGPPAPSGDQAGSDQGGTESASPMGEPIHDAY